MDLVRHHINLSFYLCELVEKIITEVIKIKSNEIELFKNDPKKIFELLGRYDTNFVEKYMNEFSECWSLIFTNDMDELKFQKVLSSARYFIADYFNEDIDKIKEIEDKTFGIIYNEPTKFNIKKEIHPHKIINNNLKKLKNTKIISIFIISDDDDYYEQKINSVNSKQKKKRNYKMSSTIRKMKKIKGLTIEDKSHRIKHNKTKIHYNYENLDIESHIDALAKEILNHQIPVHLKDCKTFKISSKNNKIKIRPGLNFKKKYNTSD